VQGVERTIIAGFLFAAGGKSCICREMENLTRWMVMIRKGEFNRKIDEIRGRIGTEVEIPAFKGNGIRSEEYSLSNFTCTGTIRKTLSSQSWQSGVNCKDSFVTAKINIPILWLWDFKLTDRVFLIVNR
jgi:hypothetical protein